jgi:hypothetical protein
MVAVRMGDGDKSDVRRLKIELAKLGYQLLRARRIADRRIDRSVGDRIGVTAPIDCVVRSANRRSRRPSGRGRFWCAVAAKAKFVADSLLDGAGFELSVPRQIAKVFRGFVRDDVECPLRSARRDACRGFSVV